MTTTEYTPWQQAVFEARLDGDEWCRIVVETSVDGAEPWVRRTIARGDDAVKVLDILQAMAAIPDGEQDGQQHD